MRVDLWILLLLGLVAGCARSPARPVPQLDELQVQLDEVLDWTYENRRLNTSDHATWQILHGALAYGRQFKIDHQGKRVSAVEHLLSGGPIEGWIVQRVELPGHDRLGLRVDLQGDGRGQGHADQWLAVLAQCGLSSDDEIIVDGHVHMIEDYVKQVLADVYRRNEYSWTIIALTHYLPTDTEWIAGNKEPWSIERLVQYEADFEVGDGPCGGTHRLIGLAMALKEHKAQGGKVEGAWQQAEQRIAEGITKARQYQNSDGSFSSNYFARGGRSPDAAQNLGTTGHTLEFLSIAMTDEQLREPWVRRAAAKLCQIFRDTQELSLECGALYHAAHGLVLYRERMFGKRTFPSTAAED